MGTNCETIALQGQIKSLIGRLGWTQNQLAKNIYTELNEVENHEELLKFQERFKKDLQRPTTKAEKLQNYILIILDHHDAKILDLTFNTCTILGGISQTLRKDIERISKEIDSKLYK